MRVDFGEMRIRQETLASSADGAAALPVPQNRPAGEWRAAVAVDRQTSRHKGHVSLVLGTLDFGGRKRLGVRNA